MSKSKDKMYGFRFLKTILGGIFKLYYNPKFIGEENIPQDGSIIIVGNHIHVMDQCMPILMTKRPVHYMAKKEYFDDKKVAWFFKLAGCIPVDRSIKDENAKGKALEVLKKGNALGLFPEGTRNTLKKNRIEDLYKICSKKYLDREEFIRKMKKQKASHINYLEELVKKKTIKKSDMINNITSADTYLLELVDKGIIEKDEYINYSLLPFKFGAVSMAKKTDSFLIPFGITGEYKFRSKDLVVRIGKPIKVGDDLELANSELREEVIRLMDKASLK